MVSEYDRKPRQDVSEADADADPTAGVRRVIGIARRRETPSFIICDASMRVMSASPGIEDVLEGIPWRSLEPACRESNVSRSTVFHAVNDETVLRIVPLGADLFGCVVIFVESFSRRGSMFEAVKRFSLTKREAQVLQLLVRAKSNAEIADELCVASSTAVDHIKSVLRKMSVAKRTEVISKVFNLEHDILPNGLDCEGPR